MRLSWLSYSSLLALNLSLYLDTSSFGRFSCDLSFLLQPQWLLALCIWITPLMSKRGPASWIECSIAPHITAWMRGMTSKRLMQSLKSRQKLWCKWVPCALSLVPWLWPRSPRVSWVTSRDIWTDLSMIHKLRKQLFWEMSWSMELTQ